MLQKIKLMLLISTTVLLVSCYRDKGNYDYKSVNEVAIKFDKKTYSVSFDNKLVIKPIVSNTQKNVDSDNLTYKWFTYVEGKKRLIEQQVLGTKKDLSIENVRLKPRTYRVYLYVKDAKTGVEWQNDVQLNVTTLNYEGWLVLNEVNGGSRLDMITLSGDKYTVRQDVLKILGSSLTLKGLPRFVTCYNKNIRTYGIYISTSGNGTTRIDQDTFDWRKEYNISYEFVSKQPLNLEINVLEHDSADEAYILDKGDIYYYNNTQNTYFSVPYNRIDGKKFKASAVVKGSTTKSVVYDDTNKQFVQTSYDSRQSCSLISTNEDKFKWKTGKDLVYINKYYGKSGIFAILKGTSNNYFLAQFSGVDFSQNYYGKINATDFDKATAYAFSPEYGSLFYAVGSKVYCYNYLSGDNPSVELVLDKGSNVITLLKFHNFYYSFGVGPRFENYKKLQNKLIVCSYDPSGPEGSNGTMELYDVPSASGGITTPPYQSYTGFGKIKSVSYRERR